MAEASNKKFFSDRLLRSLEPAERGKRYELFDSGTKITGFGCKVGDTKGPNGKATKIVFFLYIRWGGKSPGRRTIGRYPAISLEAARAKAREWTQLVSNGIDPKKAEQEKRDAEKLQQENTFGVAVEEFFRRHLSKTRQGRKAEMVIRREFELWTARPITDITRRDVLKVVHALVDAGKPYQAHNVLGFARSIFNWAIALGIYGLEARPATGCGRRSSSAPERPVSGFSMTTRSGPCGRPARIRVIPTGRCSRCWR